MCTSIGCKFENWASNGYTFNGTVDVAPGSGEAKNIKWNLTMKGVSPGGVATPISLEYSGRGDVQVSTTSLVGTLYTRATTSGNAQGQSFTSASEADVKYTSVAITGGTATAGTVYAKVKSSGSSGGQSGSLLYDGTLEFGK